MRSAEQRINIIIGQLEGIKKMLKKEDKNCFDVVIQLKAVKSSLSSLTSKVLQEEFDLCFDGKCQDSKDDLKKIFLELFKNSN